MSYPRRQQYRRLTRAGEAAAFAAVTAMLGLAATLAGARLLGVVLLLAATTLGVASRHWLSLAAEAASERGPKTPSSVL